MCVTTAIILLPLPLGHPRSPLIIVRPRHTFGRAHTQTHTQISIPRLHTQTQTNDLHTHTYTYAYKHLVFTSTVTRSNGFNTDCIQSSKYLHPHINAPTGIIKETTIDVTNDWKLRAVWLLYLQRVWIHSTFSDLVYFVLKVCKVLIRP